MNSLVSLLWQYELPQLEIPQTILKNKNQKPHHYFYSQKQKRILRKKSPNTTIDYLFNQQSIKTTNILYVLRNNKQYQMSLNIVQAGAAKQLLQKQDFQGQFSLLENQNKLLLLRCVKKYDQGTKTNKKQNDIQIQYLSTELSCQQIQISLSKAMDKFVKKLVMSLEEINKGKQKGIINNNKNKVREIELILAVRIDQIQKCQFEILIIDAVKIQFKNKFQVLMEINYKPANTQILKNKRKVNQQKHEVISLNNSQNIHIEKLHKFQIQYQKQRAKEQQLAKNKQKLSLQICLCCDEQAEEANMKQISNQSFKKLRKQKGKIIRGFTQDYYLVCNQCYLEETQ